MARDSGLSNWMVVEVKRMKGGTDLEHIKFMIPLRHSSEDGSFKRYLHVPAVYGKNGTEKNKIEILNHEWYLKPYTWTA